MKLNQIRIMTIPNLLSMMRLLMIPAFVGLYLNGYEGWTAVILISSGLTDVVDGYVARRFNQVSDIGKALDPIADKLTQAAMLLCLMSKYPTMLLPFALLAIKELFAGITGLVVILRTGTVLGAQWHGKATTLMLYAMMILHVVWQDIPAWASNCLNAGCIAMMLLSMVLYGRRNICAIRSAEEKAA